jgi:hypothetical protein
MHVYFSLRASAHFTPKRRLLWLTPFSAIYHPAHLSEEGMEYRSRALQSLFWCIGSFAAVCTLVLTLYLTFWIQNVTHAEKFFQNLDSSTAKSSPVAGTAQSLGVSDSIVRTQLYRYPMVQILILLNHGLAVNGPPLPYLLGIASDGLIPVESCQNRLPPQLVTRLTAAFAGAGSYYSIGEVWYVYSQPQNLMGYVRYGD